MTFLMYIYKNHGNPHIQGSNCGLNVILYHVINGIVSHFRDIGLYSISNTIFNVLCDSNNIITTCSVLSMLTEQWTDSTQKRMRISDIHIEGINTLLRNIYFAFYAWKYLYLVSYLKCSIYIQEMHQIHCPQVCVDSQSVWTQSPNTAHHSCALEQSHDNWLNSSC